MFEDLAENVSEDIAENSSEGDRSVFGCQRLVTFLKRKHDICQSAESFPVCRDLSKIVLTMDVISSQREGVSAYLAQGPYPV